MKKFVKTTCTTLAIIGLCVGSAFATDYNGDLFNEVGGLTIGQDGSTAPVFNEIKFGAHSGLLNFYNSGTVDFNGTGMLIFDSRSPLATNISGTSTSITSTVLGAVTTDVAKKEQTPGHTIIGNYKDLANTGTFSALILATEDPDDLYDFDTALMASKGSVFVGMGETETIDYELGYFGQTGLEVTEWDAIYMTSDPIVYTGDPADLEDPETIDPTKIQYNYIFQNLIPFRQDTDGPKKVDGYSAGAAGRSVKLVSMQTPIFYYDEISDEFETDYRGPSAELWLYEKSDDQTIPDDPDARLIAYEGDARLMTKASNTSPVTAEVRVEAGGDVVIRLGANH